MYLLLRRDSLHCFAVIALSNVFFLVSAQEPTPEPSDTRELPQWFIPVYWVLIVLVFLFGAIMQAGHSHVAGQISTSTSVISLILLDSLAYVTMFLSAVLLVIATIVTRPWEAISPTFLSPLVAFIASWIFAQAMQLYERRILSLWFRVSSMTMVNDIDIDLVAVRRALEAARSPPGGTPGTEDDILALVRNDRGTIADAADCKGSERPFLTFLDAWWRRGNAASLPKALVRQRINGSAQWRVVRRTVTHERALRNLERAGRNLLRSDGVLQADSTDRIRSVRVLTSFDQSVRRIVHAKFGNVWMRVARQPGLDKRSDGWWFIGAEVVQALKGVCGITFLSDQGRFDDAKELWAWVDDLGYGWRKEFQIEAIAAELAREFREDEGVVTDVACEKADLRRGQTDASPLQQRLASEAIAVASLGLAIRATISKLQSRVGLVCQRLEEILRGVQGHWEFEERGHAMVIALESSQWPEENIAKMLFQWVGEAAIAMGRPGGPGIVANAGG